MLKSYKAIFNRNELLVEDNALNDAKIIQKTKTTSKNEYIMHLVAEDVLDCLKRAKELYIKHFECNPKSIEIEKTSVKINQNTQALEKDKQIQSDNYLNLARAIMRA